MIVLSQALRVKSGAWFSQTQLRNCMDSKFAIAGAVRSPAGIKVGPGSHSNNVSCSSSILYIRMTVPFMGRDHYFNDKNLFQEIKIQCSS